MHSEMETAVLPQSSTSDPVDILDEYKSRENTIMDAGPECPQPRRFRLTIEPVLFLAMFGTNFSGVLVTNLLLVRSCEHMDLKINCSSMDTESGGPEEKMVQSYVTTLNMYKLLIESLVPAILAFFIGPWSDTYGRRPLMMAPLIGYGLNNILLVAFVWFNMPPMFILLASIPLGALGGYSIFFTGAFCYLNDILPLKALPVRLAIAEAFLFTGLQCGITAGSYLFSVIPSHGYEIIFFIGFCCCFLTILYVIFFVPESIADAKQHSTKERLKAMCDWKQAADLFRVCFGRHDGYCRSTRLILVVVSLLSIITLEGTIAISLLYTRTKFSWDLQQYTNYTNAAFSLAVAGTLFGIFVLSKLCKLPNGPLTCLGFFLKAVGYAVAGLGKSGWCMYLSSAIVGLGGLADPLQKAMMSETLPKNDIGKLYSITSAFKSAAPLMAGPSYSTLYVSTLNSFPGAVFLLSAALSTLSGILLGVAVFLRIFYRPHPYRLAEESQDQDRLS